MAQIQRLLGRDSSSGPAVTDEREKARINSRLAAQANRIAAVEARVSAQSARLDRHITGLD